MTDIFASMLKRMRDEKLMIPIYIDLPFTRTFALFFPSKMKGAPLLVFSPGGPGETGYDSIFKEYSPYIYDEETKSIKKNSGPYNLTSRFNLLYIDAPGDVGYSVVKKPEVYGDQVFTNQVVRVIKMIVKQYGLENNAIDFFGYSYAGKIWPLVAEQLYKEGYKIGGLAIFSGYTDPIRQEIRPLNEFLLYGGLINSSEYQRLESATDQIERLVQTDYDKNWRQAQSLYINTLTNAWGIASAFTYDVKLPSLFVDPLDKDEDEDPLISAFMSSSQVKTILGVPQSVTFHPEATVYSILTYKGFLQSSAQALKFLADQGVPIIFVMGTMDGAVIAKGTRDMMQSLFNTRLVEERWFYPLDNGEKLIGKISKVRPNVYYGTVIGSGHSLDTVEGSLGFIASMQYLQSGQLP